MHLLVPRETGMAQEGSLTKTHYAHNSTTCRQSQCPGLSLGRDFFQELVYSWTVNERTEVYVRKGETGH